METLFIYIVKVNIALAVFYLLYMLLFRKDTFIRLRRYYFLSAIIFSLFYPLFTVSALGNIIDWRQEPVAIETSVYIGEMTMGQMIFDDVEEIATPIDWTVVVKNILLVGTLLLSIRLLWQLFSIISIKSRSEKRSLFGYLFYHLKHKITPFSFFNWIFVNTDAHNEKELKQILLHEHTHARQWHSLDILLVEMLRIAFWWNPIVWFMKRDIAINLEYLADEAVLQEGVETTEYQYHLLQLTNHETAVQIVNNFNVSQLKQRIIMMNKNKSPMRKLAKYLSVLPLVLLFITANSMYAQTNEMQETSKEIAPPPPPPQEPQKKESKSNEVFVVVEKQPEFPGGTQGLMKFLSENIDYPKEAQDKGIQGRVIVSFVVEKDGSVADVQVVRGQDPLLDAEATRVIPLMPNWTPGLQKGERVRVRYTLPVVFSLPKGVSASTVVGVKHPSKDSDSEVWVIGSGETKDVTPQTLAEKFGKDKPIYVLDGKRVKDIENIDPKTIESMSVLKNESAIEKYGEEGKDGVIEIITKSAVTKDALMDAAKEKLGGEDIFVVVEDQPEFPGGPEALMKFIGENVKYPKEAQENGIQGRVIVNFVVNKDGSLSDMKVVRGQDASLDAEAIRIISTMPKWKPGMQRGEAVNVRFTLPITFRLEGDKNSDDIKELQSDPSIVSRRDQKTDNKFYEFISQRIKYPVIAQENGIAGVVRASYDVNSNGEVSNIKITKAVDPSLDGELKRIIQLMPNDIALMRSDGKAASNVAISARFVFEDTKMQEVRSEESDFIVMGYRNPTK